MFTKFCKNSRVVSYDFSMMKSIVAPWAWFSSLPIKLICSGSFNLDCLLKSIAISRLIAIDLSKQSKLKDPLQISFIGKLENQAHGATMLFIIEKS